MQYNQTPGKRWREVPSHDITQALTEEEEIMIFSKQMLINRLFLGHYQERRFVESIGSYRDVVFIPATEYDLKKDLDTVRKRLKNFYKFSDTWVGITGPDCAGAPAGYAVWVRLHNLAFGRYWFQIKKVKFVDDREMILHLKCIRCADVESFSESEKVFETSDNAPEPTTANNDTVNIDEVKQRWKEFVEGITANLASVFTAHNVREVIIFMSVFILTCVTGIFHFVRYVGDYSIKFMRELSIFIQASTPIFLATIDFFSKCIGGFYLLIAMLWRGSKVQPPPRVNWGPHQRALPAPHNMQFSYRK